MALHHLFKQALILKPLNVSVQIPGGGPQVFEINGLVEGNRVEHFVRRIGETVAQPVCLVDNVLPDYDVALYGLHFEVGDIKQQLSVGLLVVGRVKVEAGGVERLTNDVQAHCFCTRVAVLYQYHRRPRGE
ncbi:MAG: hypothetical protein ABSD63_03685 [Candidatus Korobacteraceae bacterium]